MGVYVQYGAGWSAPDGWLNFDASPTLRVERLPFMGKSLGRLSGNAAPFPAGTRYGNIVKGLPLEDGTVDGMYASHVLEHLTLQEMRVALKRSYALLKPGGIFRLIVPDLMARAKAYVAAEGEPDAANQFLLATGLGQETRGVGVTGRIRTLIGNSSHLWMFDYPAMEMELANAGFDGIRAASFGDSSDRMFDKVEDIQRFIHQDIREVAIEARRSL